MFFKCLPFFEVATLNHIFRCSAFCADISRRKSWACTCLTATLAHLSVASSSNTVMCVTASSHFSLSNILPSEPKPNKDVKTQLELSRLLRVAYSAPKIESLVDGIPKTTTSLVQYRKYVRLLCPNDVTGLLARPSS